jgi:DNA (cytosine-5)-methyltransferase 1
MQIAVNSYFSGAGLMDIGLLEAGLTINQSFELDPIACKVQRANLGDHVTECDITQKLVLDDRECDGMGFTYPCTKYSRIGDIHGVRTGDELFLHALRHLAIKRPEIYWVENVPGMLAFPVVMEAMQRLPDYWVQTFCPIRSHLWLPQRRDRLIIIGSRRPFSFQAPENTKQVSLADIVEADPVVTLPSAIKNRMEGKYRDLPIISDPERGDIAPTCVAHYAKDKSTRLVADKRFPMGVRPYSVREYARLQGVPDWFQFDCSDTDAYRMIGNGVSVPVGHWIGQEVQRYFRHFTGPMKVAA